MKVIDADGHVNDRAHAAELAEYMPRGNRPGAGIFPTLDHLHWCYLREEGGGSHKSGNPGPKEWVDFLDRTGIDWTVVYPGAGLAVGRIASWEWAAEACRAYNNWLYDRFLSVSPRIKGMALIPVQDVASAAEELGRAVRELGMLGAMLPSNGEGMKAHLGDKMFWPLYEEAEKLGCALAVHGGCHHHLGMDTFSAYYPVHALGHPFGIMIQAAGMLSHGVFDRFPKLRVGFLEGGATWVPFFMDRLDRSFNQGHIQVDRQGEVLLGPRPGERASDCFKRYVEEGRIFVGFDCDDQGLGSAVQRAGRKPFLFASDFPHEVFSVESCRREIDELCGREDLTQEDKEALLAGNAERFYGQAAHQ